MEYHSPLPKPCLIPEWHAEASLRDSGSPRMRPHEYRMRENSASCSTRTWPWRRLFSRANFPLPWLVSASEASGEKCFCPYEALEARARYIPGGSNRSCSGHGGDHLCCQSSQRQPQLGSYSTGRQHGRGFRVSDLMVSSRMEATCVLDNIGRLA